MANTFGAQVSPITSDISYSLTGKNVDLVIQDSGVLQYHPEFLDDDGKSRVRDIILDGPYYIDPSYFTSNSYTYTKPDGRIGITTTSAHAIRKIQAIVLVHFLQWVLLQFLIVIQRQTHWVLVGHHTQ